MKRVLVSVGAGVLPLALYGLSYVVSGHVVALAALGIWIGVIAYSYPGWR